MTDLETLQRITAYIRQARIELVAGLDEMDRSDLARVVPEAPAHVREDVEGRKG